MATGYSGNEYGPHEYEDRDGTSDCRHGCGCWMGPSRSGGPSGLDPGGACPKNLVKGVFLGSFEEDCQEVILQRITRAERRASEAERKLKDAAPGALQLGAKVRKQDIELARINKAVSDARDILKALES